MQHDLVVSAGERGHLLDCGARSGGASTRRLPGTSAAGWASQVGYRTTDLAARLVGARPPSKPSNDGGWRNSVRRATRSDMPDGRSATKPGVGRRTDPAPARVLAHPRASSPRTAYASSPDAPHDADREASDRVGVRGLQRARPCPPPASRPSGHEEEDTIYEHGARLERQRHLPAHHDTDRAEVQVDLQCADGPPGDEHPSKPADRHRPTRASAASTSCPVPAHEAGKSQPSLIHRSVSRAVAQKPRSTARTNTTADARAPAPASTATTTAPCAPSHPRVTACSGTTIATPSGQPGHRLADLRRAHGCPSEARSDVRPQEPDPEQLTTDRRRRREVVDGVTGQTTRAASPR